MPAPERFSVDDYLNDVGATPIVTSPDHPGMGGSTPVAGMQSAYAAFTPGPQDMAGDTSPVGSPNINTSMLKRVPPLFTNLHMVAGKLRLGGQRLVWEVLVETLMGIHLLAR